MASKGDPFGVQREQRITKSGVRRIFTPHQPISEHDLFRGRHDQVRKLIEIMNTPGQHALLYGDRGVGKSSLANIVARLFLKEFVKGQLYVKRCDSDDTFETIVADPLDDLKFFDRPIEHFVTRKDAGEAGMGLFAARASASTSSERGSKAIARRLDIQPSVAASHINGHPGLLVIDETDAIRRTDDKAKLAEFVKLLSDGASPFKVLIVGIADDAATLTAAHPSVQRCLKETKLQRMSEEEIREIVERGAEAAKLAFDADATRRIVKLSAGFPHFAHLLALKCAEGAVADGRSTISSDDLRNAISQAAGDAEGTLRGAYDTAVRSADTDMYRVTALAAAMLDRDEFTASDLRKSIEKISAKPIGQPALNNYLTRLVSDDQPKSLLRRLAKGVYRFTDPRMPSYVKIVNGITD